MNLRIGSMLVAVLFCSTIVMAEDHVVESGRPWPGTDVVKPGDRLLLVPGMHPSVTLRGYRGTPEAPIIIDSVDQESPAIIGGGQWTMDLQECDHITIGTLLLTGGIEGCLRIHGTRERPSRQITVQGSYLAKPGQARGSADGIDARFVDGLGIMGVRIDHWQQAAITLSDCDSILMLNVICGANLESKIGLEIGSNVRKVDAQHFVAENIRGVGVLIATNPKTTEAAGAQSDETRYAAEDIRLLRCSFVKTDLPITVGSANNVMIRQCMFFEPSSCILGFRKTIAPFSPASNITFERNLSNWSVGGLQRFLCNAEDAQDLIFGENLWWSQEMPEAVKYLGPLPGDANERQVYDVDPRLTPRTLAPQTGNAVEFGPRSPKVDTGKKDPAITPPGPE